jgi:hypothetical protein
MGITDPLQFHKDFLFHPHLTSHIKGISLSSAQEDTEYRKWNKESRNSLFDLPAVQDFGPDEPGQAGRYSMFSPNQGQDSQNATINLYSPLK